MSQLDGAADWLGESLMDFAGTPGTIRRGNDETDVTVVKGSNRGKLMTDDQSAYVVLKHQQHFISPSQYRFGGSPTKPIPGDRLTICGEEYVAVPIADSDDAWTYSDQNQTFYKIQYQYEGTV